MRFVVFSLWLCSITFSYADDLVLFDFEGKTYDNWVVEGTAFGKGPIQGGQFDIIGFRGNGLVNSFSGGDGSVGSLTSPMFTISKDYLAFLIGGGDHPKLTGIELLIDGKSVRDATGSNSGVLRWHTWDVKEFRNKKAQVRIFDQAKEGWGHINLDHIILSDKVHTGSGTFRLDEYRKSGEYYRERYRPQFHFSPELNWMNDPNGLVYYQGEYHLFYQHNPHGNSWGHMSWGHAVSKDLVHWKHLPIALQDEYGLMIFSGCCVVDWKNSSGFGKEKEPPLVAIYTGHGHGKQTQDLAYSNDRGRTWTKYEGNPVLDIGEADFRDPKVIWYEPTQKWIMVVSLAVKKQIRFYESLDLKKWTHLSDFGPSGATKVPNWECPDLFELPIEGEKDKKKWVLSVNIGGGAISGGSGCQYFLGEFDGKKFVSDLPKDDIRWVDYGRDFYASVSWSDIPSSDGRRMWIGWMNNWETERLPTSPWRSSMSVPRSLSLRRIGNNLQLIQTPVRELEALRKKPIQINGLKMKGGAVHKGMTGDKWEMIVEFEIGSGKEFGFQVRQGKEEKTIIGYDVTKKELFVDRTKSGNVGFHKAFPGRHSGPMIPDNKTIRMHLFVDTSSVEVFGNRGETVLSDCIFPHPESQGIEIYSKDGETILKSLTFWPLRSIWHKE